jgi:hypothetical protein
MLALQVALVAFADVVGFEFVGEVNGAITLNVKCPAPWLGVNFAGIVVESFT